MSRGSNCQRLLLFLMMIGGGMIMTIKEKIFLLLMTCFTVFIIHVALAIGMVR